MPKPQITEIPVLSNQINVTDGGAFLGSSRNLRGYRKNRFAGDGSLYASLEARFWLFRGRLIAPGRWGIFGLTDVGRVYLEGETSDKWHASYGGGIFFQMLTLNSVFHLSEWE